ncbi:MAG: ABC transporter permease [Clostridia bacterium]|nr:ABC transporter permease [Clostridia bacterium]
MSSEITGKKIKEHEPLITISRRKSMAFWVRLAIRAGSVLVALIVCGLITRFVTGDDPISVYSTMLEGNFGDLDKMWYMFYNLAMLLGVALALTPAFRMKFWNIGGEGQVLIGGLATAVCMIALGGRIPDWSLILVMLISSVTAGAVWGIIPAAFKAKWRTNETLFTLMMNYVAMYLIKYFIERVDQSGSHTVGPKLLSHGWLPTVLGEQYLLNIIVIAALTVIMYAYLNYSKHGYEISVVGESENTARYVGINVKKVIIRTMALSGALCGLIGFLLVGGFSHSIDPNIADGRGFTAILVSWLAKFNPFTMVVTSFLIVFMDLGAEEIATKFGINPSFSDIMTGIIIFFIIGCEFFINYQIHFRKKAAKEAE